MVPPTVDWHKSLISKMTPTCLPTAESYEDIFLIQAPSSMITLDCIDIKPVSTTYILLS